MKIEECVELQELNRRYMYMINTIYIILIVLNLISLIVNVVREFRFLETEQYGLANAQGISGILNAVVIFGLLILMKL